MVLNEPDTLIYEDKSLIGLHDLPLEDISLLNTLQHTFSDDSFMTHNFSPKRRQRRQASQSPVSTHLERSRSRSRSQGRSSSDCLPLPQRPPFAVRALHSTSLFGQVATPVRTFEETIAPTPETGKSTRTRTTKRIKVKTGTKRVRRTSKQGLTDTPSSSPDPLMQTAPPRMTLEDFQERTRRVEEINERIREENRQSVERSRAATLKRLSQWQKEEEERDKLTMSSPEQTRTSRAQKKREDDQRRMAVKEQIDKLLTMMPVEMKTELRKRFETEGDRMRREQTQRLANQQHPPPPPSPSLSTLLRTPRTYDSSFHPSSLHSSSVLPTSHDLSQQSRVATRRSTELDNHSSALDSLSHSLLSTTSMHSSSSSQSPLRMTRQSQPESTTLSLELDEMLKNEMLPIIERLLAEQQALKEKDEEEYSSITQHLTHDAHN